MNTAEKIACITGVANSWRGSDRYLTIQYCAHKIHHFPDKERDGFTDDEWCYHAEIQGTPLFFLAKTVDEALDGLLTLVREQTLEEMKYLREQGVSVATKLALQEATIARLES